MRVIVGTPMAAGGASLVKPWDVVLMVLGALIVLVGIQTLWALIL